MRYIESVREYLKRSLTAIPLARPDGLVDAATLAAFRRLEKNWRLPPLDSKRI